MAKNWNVREFTNGIANVDTKKETIADAGKRFALASNLISAIMATNAKEDFIEFANALPDWVTLRKVEAVLKDGVNAIEEEEKEEVKEAEPEKEEKPKRGRKKAVKVEEPEAEEEEEKEEAPKKSRRGRKPKTEKEEKPAKKAKVEEPEEEEEEDEWEI